MRAGSKDRREEQGIPENTVKYGCVGEWEVKMSGGGNQDCEAGLREPHTYLSGEKEAREES